MILPRSFYLRADVLDIAQELLGKVLVSTAGSKLTSGMIVETEAYRAPDDKGSHAYNNRRTKRTSTMFQEGGICYIYLCYGIHHLFNVVSGYSEQAHAILVRAVEPLEGLAIMQERRKLSSEHPGLTNGPGKFTEAMGIKTSHNGTILTDEANVLKVLDAGIEVNSDQLIKSPRVGIAYARECAHWPWRFRIRDNRWTSKPDLVEYP